MSHSRFGYMLLALMVLTGLAGTVSDSTLSRRERVIAIEALKKTASAEAGIREKLSDPTLSDQDREIVQKQLDALQSFEDQSWLMLRHVMERPAPASSRRMVRVMDQEISKMIAERNQPLQELKPTIKEGTVVQKSTLFAPKSNTRWIRYVRNSTEDLRHHVLQTSIGALDGYQFILYLNACKATELEKINAILLPLTGEPSHHN